MALRFEKNVAFTESEYNGFGIVKGNDGKWYEDVAVFADDFSTDTTGNYTATNATLSVVDGKLKLVNTTTVSGSATKTITTVVGNKYKVVFLNIAGTDNSLVSFAGVSVSHGDTVTADGVSEDLVISVDSAVASDYSLIDNIAVIPLNDDGSVDVSNGTALTNGASVVAKINVDADGDTQREERIPNTLTAEVVKSDRVECSELGFTPVIYSGDLRATIDTTDTIIDWTSNIDNTSSMTAGIYMVPEGGKYLVNGNFSVRSTSINDTSIELRHNGTTLCRAYTYSGDTVNTYKYSSLSRVVECKKGDTLYVYIEEINLQVQGHSTNPQTTLTIQKIGE